MKCTARDLFVNTSQPHRKSNLIWLTHPSLSWNWTKQKTSVLREGRNQTDSRWNHSSFHSSGISPRDLNLNCQSITLRNKISRRLHDRSSRVIAVKSREIEALAETRNGCRLLARPCNPSFSLCDHRFESVHGTTDDASSGRSLVLGSHLVEQTQTHTKKISLHHCRYLKSCILDSHATCIHIGWRESDRVETWS